MYGDWNISIQRKEHIQLIFLQKKHIGLVFMLVGLLLFFIPLSIKGYSYVYPVVANTIRSKTNTLLSTKNFNEKKETTFPPTHIVIPAISVDLPIVEAPIVDGYWETSSTTASHGVGSANPGEQGNMVIFAHARQGLFLNLQNIKKNDIVYVFAKEKKYTYQVEKITFVTPDDIQVISQTKDSRVTLFTCSGFLDSKRLIIIARPMKS